MRTFIAVDMPENVKQYFTGLQLDIKTKADGKLSYAKEFHLTLKFLGEINEKDIPKIIEKLSSIKFKKIIANTLNIGIFPSESSPRVVWVGLKPEQELRWLQQEIDNKLSAFYPKDERFTPHITLARVKSLNNKREFEEKLKNIETKKIDFEISFFALIKSTLTQNGPIYERISSFALE